MNQMDKRDNTIEILLVVLAIVVVIVVFTGAFIFGIITDKKQELPLKIIQRTYIYDGNRHIENRVFYKNEEVPNDIYGWVLFRGWEFTNKISQQMVIKTMEEDRKFYKSNEHLISNWYYSRITNDFEFNRIVQ